MIAVAFTLGFFGSLHCIGMCGPLALGISRYNTGGFLSGLSQAVLYNLGRVVTYTLIGAVLSLLGGLLIVSGLQRSISVVMGIALIIMFFMSLDFERLLNRSNLYKLGVKRVSKSLGHLIAKGAKDYPLFIGMLNGLLPCGLVYLAITGSLLSDNLWNGMLFMTLFGLGTFPAMMALMILGNRSNRFLNFKRAVHKIFPWLQLAFGAYLIYRGLVLIPPSDIDFWVALKNPVMCH